MNPSTLKFHKIAAAILCSAILPSVVATAQTTASTDPVGFMNKTYAGNTDSYTSIAFKRTPEYAGAIASVSGSTLTPSGTPSFGNLVYSAGTQPKRYYILFTSGAKLGLYYTITANTATNVTVNTNGDDLSTVANSTFQIIPYDTLGTIFPGGAGVNGSSSHSAAARNTEILIPDNTTAGTDLAAAKSYYYYTGTAGVGPGWRLAGVTGTIANDDVLIPDAPFIVRHNIATQTTATFMGTVHMGTLKTPIGTIATNTAQDNAVTLPIASDLTLSQTNLFQSGAFVGSSSHSAATRQDELLVWDNAIVGKNKAADRSYYYYTGTAGSGPGWRLAGVTGTIQDTTVVFSASTSVAVRKKSTGAPSTVLWAVKAPYVPSGNP